MKHIIGHEKGLCDRYGNRADVAALYADALMLLHPWKYWKKPVSRSRGPGDHPGARKRPWQSDPEHPGANH